MTPSSLTPGVHRGLRLLLHVFLALPASHVFWKSISCRLKIFVTDRSDASNTVYTCVPACSGASVMSNSVTSRTTACQAPLSMGFFQAKILEWVDMPSSRECSWPRDRTHVSCSYCARGRCYCRATGEAKIWYSTGYIWPIYSPRHFWESKKTVDK